MSGKNEIIQKVREHAEAEAETLGASVWDVGYAKEGHEFVLRVLIEKGGGVSIDDCEKISRSLDPLLEELEKSGLLTQNYSLEVSSCGDDKRLREDWHFNKMDGREIEVKLFQAYKGVKILRGTLENGGESFIVKLPGGEKVEIKKSEAAYVKEYIDYDAILKQSKNKNKNTE